MNKVVRGSLMKVSRYIPKLAYDNVKKKKSRSLLSFISVMLSSCIIFASLTLFLTVLSLSKTLADETHGTWHYLLEADKISIEDPFRYQVSYFTQPNENNISYYQLDEDVAFFNLKEGKLAQKNSELLASINSSYQVGQQVGDYTICGLYEPSFSYEAPLLSIDETYKQEKGYYFICDARIQDAKSLDDVALLANIDSSLIVQNNDRITNDIIANYLQDTTTILMMFIFIIVIAILMCLVSIYNVLIVNDQNRRKEIGLLKSIGITTKELKAMLFIEFAIIGLAGGLVGIFIGSVICSAVLYSVLENFKVGFSLAFILKPSVILIALLGSCALMIGSGFRLYRHYFTSSPVMDLKGEPVQYDVPYNAERFSTNSATWRMFVIYNERIKKQTKNLRRSFFFVMLVITLFCGIWISNFLYQKNYQNVQADEAIDVATLVTGDRTVYEAFDTRVYELGKNEQTKLKSAIVERSILGFKFNMPMASFTDDFKRKTDQLESVVHDDIEWSTKNHFGLVLDDVQLKELEPYIVYGSLHELNENSVVLVCNEKGYYTFSESTRAFDQTYPVRVEGMNMGMDTPIQFFDVDVIIDLPFEEIDLQYSNVNEHCYSIGFTTKSFKKLYGGELSLSHTVKLSLENSANHTNLHHALLNLLSEMNLKEQLQLTDYVETREDGSFAVFIIEVLLYPLFLMLVLVGCINIHNVLKGNIHMKKTDFATLKSVGMTDYQLRTIMIYEYAENFINAGALAFGLSIPVYILENFFNIASTFKIGDSFAGMYVVSFAIISPLIVVILAILSFRHIKNITALDGMKEVG